jgi:lambda repressor-like predicted transcriptional regulator
MEINTEIIKQEMKRTGQTLASLGQKMNPPMTRQGVGYLIHNAKCMRTIDNLAKALGVNPVMIVK